MDRTGVGILGGGGAAAEGHLSGYLMDPRCAVRALWDVDAAKALAQAQRLGAADAAIYTSLGEFLRREDIQAVSVCTPDHLHGEHAHAALRAGKHVLCEKPMTTTRADAARLVQDVRETGVVFVAGQIVHHDPYHQAMAQAYRAGEIGEAWLAEGDYISDMRAYYGPDSYTPWRTDARAPQDILLGGGCHPLGVLLWAMQTAVQQVFAYANHKAEPTLPIEDCYVVSMVFTNGALGKLIAASGSRGAAPTGGRLVIYGTRGTLWGGRLYRNDPQTHRSEVVRDFKDEFKGQRPKVQGTLQVQYWGEQCSHFLDCIQGKAEPLTSVVDGARVVAALEAAIESARTNRPVEVDNDF
ncbi:MAG: Gfo/Idh/MocA family oxidoreductase [Caldilineaceae bacterium]|nr:Gfo/Idh/MocA family oxidoreductase [Caldilineaceae bacterium]